MVATTSPRNNDIGPTQALQSKMVFACHVRRPRNIPQCLAQVCCPQCLINLVSCNMWGIRHYETRVYEL